MNINTFIEHEFRRFDHRLVGNMATYGADMPTEYNLSRSTFPASIYYGSNDFLVNPQDVIEFSQALPNVVRPPHRIPLKKFSHIDFFLATDAKTLLYDQIIKDLEEDKRRLHRR